MRNHLSSIGLLLAAAIAGAQTVARPSLGRNRSPTWATVHSATSTAAGARPIIVKGPTLIAFFRTTQAEVDSSGEVSETLSDFDFYLESASDSLRALGIAVYERYTDTIQYTVRGTGRRFVGPPDSGGVGYLFLVPGRPPRARYGLLSDDLIVVAREYFRGALR